jgi:hypothetical protein
MNPLHLPDVSEFQPDVDWKPVAARACDCSGLRAAVAG